MDHTLFIALDFNISLGDIVLVLLTFLALIGISIFLIVVFLRKFRKEGTGAHFLSHRILPKLIVFLLLILVLYALFS